MRTLRDLPNLGNVLVAELIKVGLDTPEALCAAGAKEAFLRIKTIDPTACRSKLYALAGAVQGIRWHHLSPKEKQELNEFFATL